MASPLASFELRKATEADLIEWGNVAGLAFAFKGGDPGRFLANHLADAEVAPAAIRVSFLREFFTIFN